MKNKIKNIKKIQIIILCFLLNNIVSSCIPTTIALGAGVAGIAFSKDRSIGTTIDDVIIKNKIKAKLITSDFKKLYSKIDVYVLRGRVCLMGEVESEEMMKEALKIAWSTSSITSVENGLTIAKNEDDFSIGEYTQDSIITGKIKSKMFLNKSIKTINYNIVTYKGHVSIFGIARSKKEIDEILKIISSTKNVKKIIPYIKIHKDSKLEFKDRVKKNIRQNIKETKENSPTDYSKYFEEDERGEEDNKEDENFAIYDYEEMDSNENVEYNLEQIDRPNITMDNHFDYENEIENIDDELNIK